MSDHVGTRTVERRRVQARLYRAALEVSNEIHESLHPGEKLDEIADTEVIEVSVSLLRELSDAVGDYER
jgi:hypothetical protein